MVEIKAYSPGRLNEADTRDCSICIGADAWLHYLGCLGLAWPEPNLADLSSTRFEPSLVRPKLGLTWPGLSLA